MNSNKTYLSHFQKTQIEVERIKRQKERRKKKQEHQCHYRIIDAINECREECASININKSGLYICQRNITCILHNKIHSVMLRYSQSASAPGWLETFIDDKRTTGEFF